MSIEYKKNYIKNFLVRFDLETKLNEGEYDKIQNILRDKFPIKETKNIENRELIINTEDKNNPKPILSEPNLKVQSVLYNAEKNERISINSDSIIYESLQYKSFSNIKPILENIIDCLNKEYGIKNFNRIGLRYVNLIKIPIKEKKDIFNWRGYINSQFLSNNNFINDNNLLQEIKTIDFNLDKEKDLLCRLQIGIPNRNMPADLVEKLYIIDIDGYTNSLVEQEDAIDILKLIHDKNVEIFEKCIDDKLRSDMNE